MKSILQRSSQALLWDHELSTVPATPSAGVSADAPRKEICLNKPTLCSGMVQHSLVKTRTAGRPGHPRLPTLCWVFSGAQWVWMPALPGWRWKRSQRSCSDVNLGWLWSKSPLHSCLTHVHWRCEHDVISPSASTPGMDEAPRVGTYKEQKTTQLFTAYLNVFSFSLTLKHCNTWEWRCAMFK